MTSRWVPLATGFRPFFLLAAVWAVCAPLWWVGVLTGQAPHLAALPPLSWHVHEMLFGFTGAVVAGFLLTAVQNWTGQTTATGGWLGGLTALWVIARLQSFVDLGWAGTAIDVAFFPALALAIGRPLWATGNRRNALFPFLLLILGGTDLALHLGAEPRWLGGVAVDAVTVMVVLVGGRVIPMFTRNALKVQPTSYPWLERASVGSVLVLLGWDLLSLPGIAAVLSLACLLQLARLAGWRGEHTLKTPILWVLHLGYLWMALALGVRAAAELGGLPLSVATHLLTVGGIGTITLGMMSRVALGHTGRKLVVPGVLAAAFVAVSIATVLRAAWSVHPHPELLWASAVAFAAAFAVYVVRYAGILTRPRADGKPG